MVIFTTSNAEAKPPPLAGGPLGLGDPDDKRLRKTERDLIIPKMLKEEALKRCDSELKDFLHCAKREGVLVVFNCRKENDTKNNCVSKWVNNSEFIREVTDQYLELRTHYRRTGEPLVKYERVKSSGSSGFC